MDLETWARTRLWEEGDASVKNDILEHVCLITNELPIIYTYIDASSWTMITTRTVWYRADGRDGHVFISEIANESAGNFKGYEEQTVEHLTIETVAGVVHRCPFETGKPSMGPIYAIGTLRKIVAVEVGKHRSA